MNHFEELEAEIIRVEALLLETYGGVAGRVPLTSGVLEFGKHAAGWRLYVEHPSGSRTPLTSVAVVTRIEAIQKLGLMDMVLAEMARDRDNAMSAVIQALRDFVPRGLQ